MATNPTPTGTRPSLVDRVKNILMTPKTEWPVIAAEPSSIGDIYRGYVIILAAIPSVAMAIGLLLMGTGFFRFSMGFVIGQAVLGYVLTLVGVYILALIVEALAPSFGGNKDRLAAFKLAAYSMTPAWIAGIFAIIPYLAILGLIGAIYGLYLLWIGLPVLMRSPEDKTPGYAIAIIVCYIVIYFIIGFIAQKIMWAMMPPVSTVTFTMPG